MKAYGLMCLFALDGTPPLASSPAQWSVAGEPVQSSPIKSVVTANMTASMLLWSVLCYYQA